MSTLVEVAFFTGTVLPPAFVILGFALLLWPGRRAAVEFAAPRSAHAH